MFEESDSIFEIDPLVSTQGSLNDKGSFTDKDALEAAHPIGEQGWFARTENGLGLLAWSIISESWENVVDDSINNLIIDAGTF